MSLSIKQNVVVTGDVSLGNALSIQGDISMRSMSLSGDVNNVTSIINRDYNPLINHPRINDVELIQNKTSEELGLEPTIHDITEQDIDRMMFGG